MHSDDYNETKTKITISRSSTNVRAATVQNIKRAHYDILFIENENTYLVRFSLGESSKKENYIIQVFFSIVRSLQWGLLYLPETPFQRRGRRAKKSCNELKFESRLPLFRSLKQVRRFPKTSY